MRKYRYFVPVTFRLNQDGTFIPLAVEFDGISHHVQKVLQKDTAWSRTQGYKYPHWLLQMEGDTIDLYYNGLNAFWVELPVFRPDLMIETDRAKYVPGRKRK